MRLSVECIMQQHVKKIMSDSLGLADFAIGLVNSVLNLSKVFRGYSNYRGIYCKKECLKLTVNKLMCTKSCVFKLIWQRKT